MSKFQTIFIGVLVFFSIIGVGAFALIRSDNGNSGAEVIMWGTLPESSIRGLILKLTEGTAREIRLQYVEKTERSFDNDLAEAIAAGNGPDLFLLPQDKILRHRDKIYPIPFTSFPKRDFLDTFIQEGSLYLSDDAMLAVPFIIDPMVMYWNKDLFNNASIPKPSSNWNDFIALSKSLTKKNQASVISQSAVALGEYQNVLHAKEILATLFMQSNDPIVDGNITEPVVSLGHSRGGLASGADNALRFYTQFSNPTNEVYSWNRSLPNSLKAFTSGDLAMYFGFASEFPAIRQKNSNLNFDVAPIPQTKDSQAEVTFGKMYGLSILKQSPNIGGAFEMINTLTAKDAIGALTEVTGLPPVRLDLLALKPTDAVNPVFYSSAIRARAFLDPNASETESVFQTMIDDVVSGGQNPKDAIDRASQELIPLFQ